MGLRRRHDATHDVPLHDNEPAAPVDVGPLQRQQLAKPQPCTQRTEHPRMPAREVALGDRKHVRSLRDRQGFDHRLGFIAAAQILAHP